MNKSTHEVPAEVDRQAGAAQVPAVTPTKRPTWTQTEGSPLPLGVTWIEDEQAFIHENPTRHGGLDYWFLNDTVIVSRFANGRRILRSPVWAV